MQRYLPLFRLKVGLMVAASSGFGYLLKTGTPDWRLVVCALATFTLTCSCSIFNQIQEKELDAKMPRTCGRPVASGLLSSSSAAVFGVLLFIASGWLLHACGGLALLLLGAVVVVCYNGIYTPLKRVSSFSLLVGAVPGALPPVFGWMAAQGNLLSAEIVIIFLVYYLWQVPHFWLRAEKDRATYAANGIPLPSLQLGTRFSSLFKLWYAAYLTAVILVPLFPFMHSTALRISLCLIVLAAFIVTGYAFRSPTRGFHITNASMLCVMVMVAADKLIVAW